ncbi:MAG: chemotaxis protein CheD [Deltaproteobacteria bacterium]|nr:chemotaxis protein CheD [Deltaproteobacteria bacterium]
MFERSEVAVAENYFLKPGYILVPKEPTVISTVLGSCVAVCLYDRKRKAGGMNHFQLPSISRLEEATARYGNVSTLALIGMMLDDGSKIKNLDAQVFGGAFQPKTGPKNVGSENIRTARMILRRKRIPIVSEDVGGEKGRKVVYNTTTNEVAVIRVDKIRQGDWFPYIDNR